MICGLQKVVGLEFISENFKSIYQMAEKIYDNLSHVWGQIFSSIRNLHNTDKNYDI